MKSNIFLAAVLAAALPAWAQQNPMKDAEKRVAEARLALIKERQKGVGAEASAEFRKAADAYKNAEDRYQSLKGGVPFDPEMYAVAAGRERSFELAAEAAAGPTQGVAVESSGVDLSELAAPEGPVAEDSTDLDPHAGAGTLRSAASNGEHQIFAARRAFEAGRIADARASAQSALAADPASPEARLLLSELLARQGLWADSAREAAEAVRLNERDGASRRALAWSQLNLGNASDAAAGATRALALNPLDAQAFVLRAFAFERQGRADAALSDFRRAAALDRNRFMGVVERAEKGGRIFDPSDKEAWRILDPTASPRSPRDLTGGAARAGAAALAVLALVPFWRRANRQQVEVFLMRGPRRPAPVKEDLVAEAERAGLLAGKYQLKTIIGRGGMSMVWEAYDHVGKRHAAIKKIQLPEGKLAATRRTLALQEAKTLVTLRHPNIVNIYEVLDLPSGLYLVLEFLQGKTLQHILAEKKRLPWPRLKEFLRPVCAALEFAHSRGFVHRDLKPSNVMVTLDGAIKVMDFGIARAVLEGDQAFDLLAGDGVDAAGPRQGRTSNLVGTPGYRPPEAEKGIVSTAFDVYSLGAVAYEGLVGELPPRAGPGSLERIGMRLMERAEGLPPSVAKAIQASLDPDFTRRLQSAKFFRSQALEI